MSLRQVQKIKQKQQKEQVADDFSDEEIQQPKQKLFFQNFESDQEEDQEIEENVQEQEQKIIVKQDKKKKKNKKKNNQIQQKQEDDDFKILDDLKIENTQNQEDIEEIDYCLSLKLNNFNYNKELAKFFKGEKFSKTDEQKQQQKQMKMIKKQQFKTYYLSYQEKYMKIQEKFQCQINCISQGLKIFEFIPSEKYLSLQQTYETLKNTMDPQNSLDFLAKNPFHAEALYDMGEFFKIQGNFKDANSLLENLLYFYEDCFSYDMLKLLHQDKIDLQIQYNKWSKQLFQCLLIMINILNKKGCYRSALEYNKFLLKINYLHDPMGSLLIIDYSAISASDFKFLYKLIKNFGKEFYNSDKSSILYMPNMLFSLALSKFLQNPEIVDVQENDFNIIHNFKDYDHIEQNCNVLLMIGMLLYPGCFEGIVNSSEMTKQQAFSNKLKNKYQKQHLRETMKHKFFENNETPYYTFLQMQKDDDVKGLTKCIEIYIEKSKILWKSQSVVTWVKYVLGEFLQFVDEFDYDEFRQDISSNNFDKNLPFQFSRYINQVMNNFSDNQEGFNLNEIQDNIPQQNIPQGNVMNYDQNIVGLLLNSLMPWNNLQQNNNNQDQQ